MESFGILEEWKWLINNITHIYLASIVYSMWSSEDTSCSMVWKYIISFGVTTLQIKLILSISTRMLFMEKVTKLYIQNLFYRHYVKINTISPFRVWKLINLILLYLQYSMFQILTKFLRNLFKSAKNKLCWKLETILQFTVKMHQILALSSCLVLPHRQKI